MLIAWLVIATLAGCCKVAVILQIICKAHLEKIHSSGTFEQNNVQFDYL
jgi:hypothetical protein